MVTIIRAILPSIIAFSPEATIYIDNASTDESIAFVQQHYPAIKKIIKMLILVLLKDIMKH
jgi:hypothetical protein